MDLPEGEARRRFAASRHAVLATVRLDGSPHLVPVVFALLDEVVHTAIDHKPKRSRQLQRLANLEHEPRCSLLVDRYDDEWSQLWWVRADGQAEIMPMPDLDDPGAAALIERYAGYRTRPPTGPLVRITIMRWSGWAAG
jgi:PPOX class probable F420-dependent enzyme